MKKLIGLILIIVMLLSPVTAGSAENDILQESVDTFGVCVVQELTPYIIFGFTTEYAVSMGFDVCVNEAQNLIDVIASMGGNQKKQAEIIRSLYLDIIKAVDLERNKQALENMKNSKEKMKEVDI